MSLMFLVDCESLTCESGRAPHRLQFETNKIEITLNKSNKKIEMKRLLLNAMCKMQQNTKATANKVQ